MPALRSLSTRDQSRENNVNEACNKESSNQSNQSISLINQSNGPQSASLPVDNVSSNPARSSVELAMPWITRDRIVNALNQFSMLLFRQAVSKEIKEQAVKQTNSLMTSLIGLTSAGDQARAEKSAKENVQIEERPKKKARTEKAKKNTQIVENGESNACRAFFLIPLRMRSELLDHLVRNMDAVCYPLASLDESAKNQMREQNTRLNIQLLKLPITLMTSSTPDESDPFGQLSTSLEITLAKFGEKLDQTVAESHSELLSTWNSEFGTLRESLQKLETSVQRFEAAANSEITMNYELVGVEAFFRSKGVRYSKCYMCNGCPWSICLDVREREEEGKTVQYLGFFISCERLSGENERWSIRAICDLLLFSPSNALVKQSRFSNIFKEASIKTMGILHFISFDNLKSQNHIANDRLKVQINLKCDPLVLA